MAKHYSPETSLGFIFTQLTYTQRKNSNAWEGRLGTACIADKQELVQQSNRKAFLCSLALPLLESHECVRSVCYFCGVRETGSFCVGDFLSFAPVWQARPLVDPSTINSDIRDQLSKPDLGSFRFPRNTKEC